jgi:hypothetical protein
MQTGTRISAIGHGAFIALALFGLPWFGPRDRETIRVTEVSFVSEAEFAAAQSAPEAAREETAPAAPPRARPAPAPVAEPEPAPEPEPAEEAPEAPEQQVAVLTPPPEQPRVEPTPEAVEPPTAAAPPARPAVRVEPDPTPPPQENLRPAEVPEPVRAPVPEPVAEPEPEETPAAPEAAAPVPAPEAVPQAPLALETSRRPVARPERQQARREEEADTVMAALKREVENEQKRRTPAVEEPAEAAKPAPEPAPATETAAAAPSSSSSSATSLPVGPPMTGSEKEGLKLAVQRCWNVPAGLRDAQELKVTLSAELNPDGSVINASIRMIEPSTAPDARFKSAFDAGRRALIRCSPYTDLPREKYAQWRNLEVVFNPEGMVSW